MWGVLLSAENHNSAEAETVSNVEGNMCGPVMRGTDALPWSKTNCGGRSGMSRPYLDQWQLLEERSKVYEIQPISSVFRGTGVAAALRCPTIMGATGTIVLESSSADLLSGAPSHSCANPIQHVPNPAAQAANIKFSAAKAESSTIQGPAAAEITISAGAWQKISNSGFSRTLWK